MKQMNHHAWPGSKRVLVIDSYPIVRRGVRAMVEAGPIG
jgi:hypothetical protein